MIVVTGGTGVLGLPLVKLLQDSGAEVHVVRSGDVNLRDASATSGFFAALRPKVVYHLAARVHGLGGNTRFPAEMFLDNIRINTNVIDAATRSGVQKIVAVSTVAAYAADLPRPAREDMIWQGPPHGAELAYGHAKRAMLAQLQAYATQFGLSYAYPILTNIYGPGDRFDPVHGHVVPSLVAKFHAAAREGGTVSIWGTGRAERDFLYAQDAARAIIRIAEAIEGPVNVATGRTVRISDVVDILSAHSGVDGVEWDASLPDGQLERSYDVTRLQEVGFTPATDIVAGLAETYDWYAANYPDVRS